MKEQTVKTEAERKKERESVISAGTTLSKGLNLPVHVVNDGYKPFR